MIATKNGGGDHGVVFSTAASHARVWGSLPGLDGLKESNMFLSRPLVKFSIAGSLRGFALVMLEWNIYK